MRLQDPDQTDLVLNSELPDEAVDALREIDWSEKRGCYLMWSAKRRQSVDAMEHPSDV